ncbi:hypothetical protein E3P86_03999 [Wallemia ichthyophaga]|uniref:SCF-associated factor 1 n=1 Tax=Wallemia ichthyophaga TaxID=245174 RepID=A0A4T0IDV4_WALIC|nr:hypothetical protein E3P86_03999 [Wallemia ichthyophaga]
MLDKVPTEIILDSLFPLLSPRDILAIGSSSRSLHALILDALIWKRKLSAQTKYIALRVLTQSSQSHNLDWQRIYKRALSPQLYVWGVATNGRLGIDFHDPRIARGNCVPTPIPIRTGIDLVQVVAGGWSFHALGRNGQVVFWGQFNGDIVPFGHVDYRNPGARVATPSTLDLPFRTVDMSAGRAHILLTDDKGRVYQSISPALTQRITHACLENDAIAQISAGWTHSALLLTSGAILIFWPHDCLLREEYRVAHDAGPRQHAHGRADGAGGRRTILASVFDYAPDAVTLPHIPGQSIAQIANAEDAILALTASGRVYRMDLSTRRGLRGSERVRDMHEMFLDGSRRWNELTHFAPENLRKLLPDGDEAPHLSHITCSFRQFTLYAPSIHRNFAVFAGDATRDDSQPTLVGLDNVVDVARGDYHALALTRDGHVRAWGSQKGGKLGVNGLDHLRDGDVNDPLPVSFKSNGEGDGGTRKRFFAFSVAAAGWHSAALVIDLEGDDGDDGDGEEYEQEQGNENEEEQKGQQDEQPEANSLTQHAYSFVQRFTGMRTGMTQR